MKSVDTSKMIARYFLYSFDDTKLKQNHGKYYSYFFTAFPVSDPISMQSRTQSNACARARKALALGKLTTGTHKFRGSGSLSACTIDKR